MDGDYRSRGALVFDASTGKPRVGLQLAFHMLDCVEPWVVDAVLEFFVNRLFALKSRVPPESGDAAPTNEELDQLGRDLFSVDSKALIGAFRRERVDELRARALAGGEDDGDDEAALEAWRSQREAEFREAAVAAWAKTHRDQAKSLATLEAQLDAIKRIEASAGAQPTQVVSEAAGVVSEETLSYMRTWANDPDDPAWVRAFGSPPLLLPKIRDVLSQPSRSEIAKGYFALLRERLGSDSDSDLRGSVYGGRWPRRPTGVTTPPDHVVPVSWLERGTSLIAEVGNPAQNPANLALCLLSENSSKSGLPLGHFQKPEEQRSQGLYFSQTSTQKKALLAKIVAGSFLSYPLISDRKSAAGVTAFGSGGSGVSWYTRAWSNGPFKTLVQRQASSFERRVNLLTSAIARWSVLNPLVFDTSLLDADTERVLERRFRGTDGISKLVDFVLSKSVQGAPM